MAIFSSGFSSRYHFLRISVLVSLLHTHSGIGDGSFPPLICPNTTQDLSKLHKILIKMWDGYSASNTLQKPRLNKVKYNIRNSCLLVLWPHLLLVISSWLAFLYRLDLVAILLSSPSLLLSSISFFSLPTPSFSSPLFPPPLKFLLIIYAGSFVLSLLHQAFLRKSHTRNQI